MAHYVITVVGFNHIEKPGPGFSYRAASSLIEACSIQEAKGIAFEMFKKRHKTFEVDEMTCVECHEDFIIKQPEKSHGDI